MAGPFQGGALWIFHDSCDDAVHNLELAPIACWNFCSLRSVSCFESSKIKKRRCAMLVALEVNFAVWIMIGLATAKAVQFVEYLY
jgi:hypothetical protein